jgi:YfiH family protein
MKLKPVLHKYDLGAGVTAFSTTRHGGVSQGSFGEFNINAYCGDTPEAIAQNRKALCDELGVDDDRLLLPHQVHGVEIRLISNEFFDCRQPIQQMLLEGVDGVMTTTSGVCIGVSTADCIPVLFYDAPHHAACAVHAGWRGTLAQIARKAVVEMQQSFLTRPADLQVCIGPGISLRNFEVGDDVYGQFASAGFDMSRMARQFPTTDEKVPQSLRDKILKWHLDLPECNRLQLQSIGVPADHIHLSGICTYEQVDDYFSARRLGVASGRVFTGIILA